MPFSRARKLTTLACAALCVVSLSRAAAAQTVVQIPVDSVLDGRSVSTLAGQTVVPWSAGQGVDGDGNADGFVTSAVEAVLQTQGKTENGKLGVALPDDGKFAATTRHPEIQLHFSNSAANTSPQTHQVHINQGAQSFQFDVPAASYSKLFLFITCSEGAAALTITLNYAGGATPTVTKLMLPDYGIGGAMANDPVFFNLIQGMDKWSTSDQEGDGPSHTITGIELDPSQTSMLTSVQVAKTNGSHAVFWGATGLATSAVTSGSGGASGSGGGAGASGSGGATNAGGSNGGTAGAGNAGASGSANSGGSNGLGGATSNAGATNAQTGATTTGNAGSANSAETSDPSTSSSCAFTPGRAAQNRWLAWLSLLALAVVVRRRVSV